MASRLNLCINDKISVIFLTFKPIFGKIKSPIISVFLKIVNYIDKYIIEMPVKTVYKLFFVWYNRVDKKEKTMKTTVSKATLGRIPRYLNYLKSIEREKSTVSSTYIAKALSLGEVQVRKDLSSACGSGKPKIGYVTKDLINCLESFVNVKTDCQAVIVGAGKLGMALYDYSGFSVYGIDVCAVFDSNPAVVAALSEHKNVYDVSEFEVFCYRNDIRVGIIAVPKESAQSVCDMMVKNNITAIWSFAPVDLKVPKNVKLKREDLALSLAHLTRLV